MQSLPTELSCWLICIMLLMKVTPPAWGILSAPHPHMEFLSMIQGNLKESGRIEGTTSAHYYVSSDLCEVQQK